MKITKIGEEQIPKINTRNPEQIPEINTRNPEITKKGEGLSHEREAISWKLTI